MLAITPWRGGVPEFAVTSPARILVCAVERRCSICGLGLGQGPVWRVVGADEAVAIAGDSAGFENAATTVEPPGHRLDGQGRAHQQAAHAAPASQRRCRARAMMGNTSRYRW